MHLQRPSTLASQHIQRCKEVFTHVPTFLDTACMPQEEGLLPCTFLRLGTVELRLGSVPDVQPSGRQQARSCLHRSRQAPVLPVCKQTFRGGSMW